MNIFNLTRKKSPASIGGSTLTVGMLNGSHLIWSANHLFCCYFTIHCVNDEQVFTCTMDQINEGVRITERVEKEMYLYEPNASIMKVGCFGACAQQYDVKAIARNSHLFVSNTLIPQFPGRIFRITAVSSMNKRELKEALQGIKKANVAVRNFPLKAEELRKKLKLSDGGDIYLFGTTTEQDKHLILLTKL